MSRQLKFRAWDGKKMVYTGDKYYCDHFDGPLKSVTEPCVITNIGIQFWLLETNLPNATPEYFDHYKIIYAEIMQFTGLKDRNGVEIYEGDIVADFDGDGPHNVEYFEDCFCLNRIQWDDKKRAPDQYEWWDQLEIIGNIYENPSLLK